VTEGELKYFKPQELVCPCCGASGVTDELKDLLDWLREKYGKPIVVNSAYRCKKHNEQVGGVPESAHTTGEAVDIGCSFAVDRMKLITLLREASVDRIGLAKTFIHFDISKTLPQDVFWLY
jgi:zinc D-Ala-D-Ala carboxypeptidase